VTSFTVTGGTPLRGAVRVPGDKSISHRTLLVGALAEGTSIARGLSTGDDVARTRAAVESMGVIVEGDTIVGGRARLHEPARVLDAGNSGTTIRLLAGLCAGFPWLTVLAGDDSVARRPMDRIAEPLRSMGAQVDGRDGGRFPPLVVRGGDLRGIDYAVPMASAQVKSAILLAGVSAAGETVVRERAVTRVHTEELLAACGAAIGVDGLTVRLRPSVLKPFELDVPGDPSQAAFWAVAACVVPGSDVTIEGVYLGPARTGFLDVLRRMGAAIDIDPASGAIRARSSELRGVDVAAAEIPGLDEVPILAVAAAMADGATTFDGIEELTVKESDRAATIRSELGALGARVEGDRRRLVVHGASKLRSASVQSHGDHRIAMAMAVAALAIDGETSIEGWDAVATSYPDFERDLELLRGK
jgi:3-phosphoshikimate 1-carboxyvinyltransferase